MLLTLSEAAAKLGKTERQIRYLVRQGKLRAEKRGGRWLIDLDDALATDRTHAAVEERKRAALHEAVREVIGPDSSPAEQRQRFSVMGIKAVEIAVPLVRLVIGNVEAQTRFDLINEQPPWNQYGGWEKDANAQFDSARPNARMTPNLAISAPFATPIGLDLTVPNCERTQVDRHTKDHSVALFSSSSNNWTSADADSASRC